MDDAAEPARLDAEAADAEAADAEAADAEPADDEPGVMDWLADVVAGVVPATPSDPELHPAITAASPTASVN